MRKYWAAIYSWIILASDLILGWTAANILWTLWFVKWGPGQGPQPLEMEHKVALVVFLLLSVLLHGGYRHTYKMNRLEQILNIYKSSLISLVFIIVVVFLIKGYRYSRGFIVLYYTAAPFLLSLGRVLFFVFSEELMKRGWGIKNAIIIGSGKTAKAVFDHLITNRAYGYKIIGFLVENEKDLQFKYGGVKAIGLHRDCDIAVKRNKVEEIFIPGLTTKLADYSDLIDLCRNHKMEVSIISHHYDLLAKVAGIYDVAGVAIVTQHGTFYSRFYPYVKRAMDVSLSTLALAVFSPVMLAIALLIKLNSPGPVFFRQTRVGRNSILYPLLKFRTMHKDAEKVKVNLHQHNEADGPIFKIKEDPRITRVGRWLRRLSLDELPQLINVFKGDMSLVGPRPPLPSEVEKYQDWHKYRLQGQQGMTGLWQVSGRSELSFEEMVLLDIYYLEHWSPMMDLEILIKTIPAVITAKGAY
ncbi:MAG: sugar transferase [Candidatus Edwardsbacteria bacterium]|nr:sugar transferase [Candidatus Edwardsbacteria bacterium]MBU1577257.1 sugar transferase [Candidatus Edwardsbacteria bacterium]MBU2463861.1 sugar transferase [Candidatus Edwardsbacteria bacterium]MBU2594858.1 sugar transferase [Candidatus Edwardsbacteria bacterium]